MKKYIVLFILFVLPIVAYLFFATGVNQFSTLPVITPQVTEMGQWKSLSGEVLQLDGKITVLGFAGYDIKKHRSNLFNLNQQVYERYHKFADLQFVYVCPESTRAEIVEINEKFSALTDMTDWHFVFAPDQEIRTFYDGLGLKGMLGDDLGTPNVFLIDKKKQLRGRNDADEYLEGYNTIHPSVLKNEMLDDFKILIYEYKAALKRNNNATKRKI